MNTDTLSELLNQKEILLFIRQLTQLVNKLNYSQLQNEQWSYYYNLGMTEGIWTGRVSKKMAEANSMCYTYGRSKVLIKQRFEKYKQQCPQIQETINEHLKQIPPDIDMTLVTNVINSLIHKDQHQLRLELDRRKTILRLDAEEHKLVDHFYTLNPRQTEINSAKIIWKALHDQQAILHETIIFKKSAQLNTHRSSCTQQDIQLPNINRIFTSFALHNEPSSTEHITQKTIVTAEEIAQNYTKIATAEKNKLLSTKTNHKNVQLLDQIITAIHTRENNMKQRAKATPLRPVLNTVHAATKQISQYLDKLIRPLFDRFVRQTTIVDGANLLAHLQKYIQKAILAEFLREHYCEKVNGVSIDTIVELGRIVLKANAFVCTNKFCRHIIGGAMGSAFTLTLANIFMWKWEKQTILPKLGSHEIYGRYIDDVFFTSNEFQGKVKELLEAANNFHPNIKLEYNIGKFVAFLDVLVKNNNGILASSIYHKPSAQPTVVSFLSDHPRHVFRNVIQTVLTRAVRYSSTFEVFNNERRAIRSMFLYNR
ncbi:unnamed protein product [Rotaria sp. Silwood2]|nr:unnamed protein product [Rotaria sp. Silwood2]